MGCAPYYFLKECVYFEEEIGVKLIYQLINHNQILFFIIHLPTCNDLIFSAVGFVPPKYVSFRDV